MVNFPSCETVISKIISKETDEPSKANNQSNWENEYIMATDNI